MEEFIKNNIEEFERAGKRFIYFNVSALENNAQFRAYANAAMEVIKKYQPRSVYVIASRASFFDTETKNICAEWISFNKPYEIADALVDVDGLSLMTVRSICKKAGREVGKAFPTLDKAVEWLLTQVDN